MTPSVYAFWAIWMVLQQTELLRYILRLAGVELFNPWYWIADGAVERHHNALFERVLSMQGIKPSQVAKLSAAEQQQLQTMAQESAQVQQQHKQQKEDLQRDHPTLAWLWWAFKPPGPQSGRVEKRVKRILLLPVKSVLPFVYILTGAATSHKLALTYLRPYLEMKGITSPAEQDAIATRNRPALHQLGIGMLILSAIPLVTLLVTFTHTVGAALWAARLEKERASLVSGLGDGGSRPAASAGAGSSKEL